MITKGPADDAVCHASAESMHGTLCSSRAFLPRTKWPGWAAGGQSGWVRDIVPGKVAKGALCGMYGVTALNIAATMEVQDKGTRRRTLQKGSIGT